MDLDEQRPTVPHDVPPAGGVARISGSPRRASRFRWVVVVALLVIVLAVTLVVLARGRIPVRRARPAPQHAAPPKPRKVEPPRRPRPQGAIAPTQTGAVGGRQRIARSARARAAARSQAPSAGVVAPKARRVVRVVVTVTSTAPAIASGADGKPAAARGSAAGLSGEFGFER